MKDKELYNKRSDGNYKGYTKDGFFYKQTTNEWVWKQNIKNQTKDKYYCAKTINELTSLFFDFKRIIYYSYFADVR